MTSQHKTSVRVTRWIGYAVACSVVALTSPVMGTSMPALAKSLGGGSSGSLSGWTPFSGYQAPATTTSTTPDVPDAWTPANGPMQDQSSVITTNTTGFNQDATDEVGGYTYNGCASQGALTAYYARSDQSYCRPASEGCPAGEKQINNDGVCQGTGSDNAGTYAQWTFSACVNGQQTQYTHDVNTGAVVASDTINCIANTVSNPAPSASPVSTVQDTTPACSAPGASSHSQPTGSSFAPTGCAGSCTPSGCTGTGTEAGIETEYTRTCTTSYSCPGPTAHTSCSTASNAYSTTQTSSTQCQQKEVLLDQCMPEEPGNREAEYCLTFNGGTTNCSAPFGVYDPTNCPIPVGIDY